MPPLIPDCISVCSEMYLVLQKSGSLLFLSSAYSISIGVKYKLLLNEYQEPIDQSNTMPSSAQTILPPFSRRAGMTHKNPSGSFPGLVN